MHPALIKAHLEIQNIQQKRIAEALGVTRTAVHSVIHGNSKSRRIEEKISEATGLSLRELWPDRYQDAA